MASTEVQHDSPQQVDVWRREPRDEPSARFGWHGENAKVFGIGAIFTGVVILFMLVGNHQGNVENIYLAAIGGLLVLFGIFRLKPAKKRYK